ncbi:bifunctional 4-hydroxy-2-oxoglutarate aldolase/2-dehydro-3-deoxy-phosphogluconate aldolase [Bradyrhizobium manausense]|uniref:bifunctional 4-hydroxy-2-oxoglutarate aldolase/2-dehydro-3-deoxy-phosphogluconate aldolase n=1 Tax=Bradyrhizobium TaxID=374 RepID=UPI001BA644EF|nr:MULTISPECIES: bifunctional 4-hydroxy-2-oxoglutarate aldolase/2-dehydro-3-deoxy-phosphogluconate aldolase [Bradyrhizobium]MBR0826377.1 bifunctional 4-hydroxy-2-oxoglutarate aldolase/2-dehydro-3-deoxy-phosphogluconate aldolase [Bradyrhizobium manausense]UVO28785.1 bifunctional 4-hydroxy-2-oxoglutarate aldolase/2-dehydro-3-deoxy-phosphogluconate aldolase [Bradyrhizobium arachidis]
MTVQRGLRETLSKTPVIPVISLDTASDAIPLARALAAGGLSVIEVTLRTAAALDSIRAITSEVETVEVGAGTIIEPTQLEAARRAGARFAVSPGYTNRLLDAAETSEIPLLPGVSSASEALGLIERNFQFAKFFPAESVGGVDFLSSLASPLPQLKFCPTGGITRQSAPRYLELTNVLCVGGSWMAPRNLVSARDWASITVASRAAAALASVRQRQGMNSKMTLLT